MDAIEAVCLPGGQQEYDCARRSAADLTLLTPPSPDLRTLFPLCSSSHRHGTSKAMPSQRLRRMGGSAQRGDPVEDNRPAARFLALPLPDPVESPLSSAGLPDPVALAVDGFDHPPAVAAELLA